MRVDLLYFPGCPNVEAARTQLRRAFAELDLRPEWSEVDVTTHGVPAALLGYGSPTILIDGRDVEDERVAHGSSCRIYRNSDGVGAPSVSTIVQALARALARP